EPLAPGGQLLKTFEIANYLGFPEGMAGWKLAENFALHLEGYDIDHLTQGVKKMEFEDKWHILTLDNETIAARAVIVCSGASPKKLGVDGEDRLTGRGVSYCAMCDGMFFRNRTVAMVGGGNSALEEALHLSNLVKKLYLIHRRDRFRADRCHQEKLESHAKNVEPVLGYTVTELHGDNALTGVTIVPTAGGEAKTLEVAGLFVFVGMTPSGGFLPDEVQKDNDGFVITDCEMRTTMPGLFAAGDIRAKQCRQVVTAVGDGATAAYSAFDYFEDI
ncbi:MAG: FAD-dependent oxidoreductase, partial [Planctomycetaceae bacterium]|nr:FAD-dependent oxidoreductase [Planctomycetaceae bacterium]